MLVTVGYAATRLILSRSWRRRVHHDVEVTHVLMGAAMAGMLAPMFMSGGSATKWDAALLSLVFVVALLASVAFELDGAHRLVTVPLALPADEGTSTTRCRLPRRHVPNHGLHAGSTALRRPPSANRACFRGLLPSATQWPRRTSSGLATSGSGMPLS